jgi:hypothetical protein
MRSSPTCGTTRYSARGATRSGNWQCATTGARSGRHPLGGAGSRLLSNACQRLRCSAQSAIRVSG